ncbi:MAG: ABC transporter permease subunit [Rhodospirillaceae bacterium]
MPSLKPPSLKPRGELWPWWRRCLVVLRKEMLDHLRDRRSLGLALIYPLLGPLVIGMLLAVSAESMRNSGPGVRAVTAATRGADQAPELVEYLSRRKVTLVPAGERDPVVLEIPTGAARDGHYSVRLLYDINSAAASGVAAQIAELITAYGRTVSERQLAARGLDLSILQPVTIERINIGRRLNIAMLFYNLIPPLVVFMIFLGAVYIALDATVGERERGTLEPLLTAPVRRWELLLGKAGAAFLFTVATLALNLIAFRAVLSLIAVNVPGLEAPPGSGVFLLMFVMALPVVALSVTVQLVVAAIARSMKEAQIYLGLLPLVPALPGVAAAMAPTTPGLWASCFPVFGQMVSFGRLITGSGLDPLQPLLSAVVTLAVAAAIFRWAIWLYEQERNLSAD